MDKVIELAKKDKDILAVALYGSSLKGKGRDIDLCIYLTKKKSNLEMSKKRLELLSGAGDNLDIQIFQQVPLYIKTRILKEGKVLFCRDEDALYEIAFATIKDFGFYKKIYDMYLNEVEHG